MDLKFIFKFNICINFFENCIQCILLIVTSTPSPQIFTDLSPHLPPALTLLCYSFYYLLGHWCVVNSPRAMPLKEIESPSHRSHQLSTSPQLEVRAHEPPPNFIPEKKPFFANKIRVYFPSEYCRS